MALQVQHPKIVPSRNDVRLVHLDNDMAVGTGNDIYVVIWRDRTTSEGVSVIAKTFSEYAKSHSREVALITVIEPKARMPSAECRAALARTLAATSPYVLISAVAFEGEGFVAASIRGVVVGLTMLARQTFPHRVFKTVAEAADWIESERFVIHKDFKAYEIRSQVASLRRLVLRHTQP